MDGIKEYDIMLVVDKKTFMFNVREIHSAKYPFDI